MSSTNIFFRHRHRAAAGAAAVALSGVLAACGSSATTATTTADTAAPPSTVTAGGRGAPPPGLGKPVTGTAAAKAKAAALAEYPGTAERVVQRPDGSYEVHVLRKAGGEVHVLVSKSFAVTGTEQRPAGGAGFGKPVTGAAAAKAKAAALAKYPGTVERVVQLPDGSYEVHVLRKSGGEVHVRVSKAFKVTGTETGPPAPPAGAGAPAPPAASGTATRS